MTAESWHWVFLIDSQWIPITWIERRLGSKRKSSISPTLTFCLSLSLSVYFPLLLSQLFTFCLSLPSCSCVPAAGATLAIPNSWGTSVFSGCVATIDKYKTKYDSNTPLSRKACCAAFKRGKAKTVIGHLTGVLLDTDGVSIDTDIVFQDYSIILTSNDCQQSS